MIKVKRGEMTGYYLDEEQASAAERGTTLDFVLLATAVVKGNDLIKFRNGSVEELLDYYFKGFTTA